MQKSVLIPPRVERVLRQIILKDLANKGRPGWDKPHTESVVYWMKYLLNKLNNPQLNSKVLITAAYAHDWGYINLFDQKTPITTINQARSKKELHMKRSQHMIERLIYERLATAFTETETLQLTHLVAIHDRLKQLRSDPEILLMECDTLGALDVKWVKPTLSLIENKKFLQTSILEKRLPLFIHEPAKKIAQQLIKERENYYQSLEK